MRHTDRKWRDLKQECRTLLQREAELREVAEIVGPEGMQDEDRLLMNIAGRVRTEFLAQNAFTEDAFSPPEQTMEKLREILSQYHREKKKLLESKASFEPKES